MASTEIELLTDHENNAVVRLPGRKYPGVVIQGDTLSTLLSTTSEALAALDHRYMSEAQDLLNVLLEHLNDAQARYEAALRDHGIERPY